MRFFNTEGPVRAEDHYAIPPLKRGNVAEILRLIRDKRYGGGKGAPSGEGGFRCVNVNVEVGQVARDDVAEGMRAILSGLAGSARLLGDDFPKRTWPGVFEQSGPNDALKGVDVLHANGAGAVAPSMWRTSTRPERS